MKNDTLSSRNLTRQIKAAFLAGLVLLSSLHPCLVAAMDLDSVAQVNAERVPQEERKAGAGAQTTERAAGISMPTWVPKEPWQTTVTQKLGTPGELIQQQATSAATDVAQAWFKQFGTVKIGLNKSTGTGISGSIDALVPIVDTGENLFFAQFGARRSNTYTDSYRTTLNLGTGLRHFFDNNVMLGGNVFFDRDVTLQHTRIGLGVELWADYVKLSANGYIRASGWKGSPDVADYLERPANGWDIRAEGFLPQYPQLGGKVTFEQYYGDEVGLFGGSNRQANPRAVTLGLSYMPFPLLTLEVAHRMGAHGLSDTTAGLKINYAIGVPLEKQLRSAGVRERRLLRSSRYDLVDRNNEIVLEYKRRDLGSIRLPAQISGYPGNVVSFPVAVETTQPVSLLWQGSAAQFLSPYDNSGTGAVTLPAYSASGPNTYQLFAIAADQEGRQIRSNLMAVVVQPIGLQISSSKATATADGVDSVQFTATLTGANSEPLVDRGVEWTVPKEATLTASTATTDKAGQAYATVASKRAANIRVLAVERQNGVAANAVAKFVSDTATYHVASVSANPATGVANNSSPVTVTALVQDLNSNPAIEGIEVGFSTSAGSLVATSAKTDANGKASVTLKGPTAVGSANVTAKVVAQADDAGTTLPINFVGDASTAHVDALATSAGSVPANGTSSVVLTATLKDTNGNPVGQGIPVQWNASLGTLASKATNTDASGKATVTLTSPVTTGSATVTAIAVAGDTGKSVSVAFVADSGTARVESLNASLTTVVAGGAQPSLLSANVKDASGNSVGAGIDVHWRASGGAVPAVTQTDVNGTAVANFVAGASAGPGSVTANAATGDAGKTVALTVIGDVLNARVTGVTSSTTSVVANGSSTVALSASVRDRSGNLLPAGVAVQWTSDLGTIVGASLTDANGVAASVLSAGMTMGTANVTAKAGPSDSGKSTAVTFTADASSAKVAAISATPNTVIANGSSRLTIKAVLKDAGGNLVGAGIPVLWSSSSGSLGSSSTTTDATGTASVVLTAPTAAGTGSVTAKASSSDPGQATAVSFTTDNSTLSVSSLAATSNTVLANGSGYTQITATLKDGNGNLAGAGFTVTWTTSLGSLSAASSVTDATGQASVRLTGGTVAGTANVSASAVAGGKAIPILVVADDSTAVVTSLTVGPGSIPANGAAKSTVTVAVADANGNSVGSGVTVNWVTTGGTLAATTSVTDATGHASTSLTSSVAAGTVTVTGSAGGAGKSGQVVFTPDASTAQIASVAAAPNTLPANGASASTVSATVKDANGNLMGAGVAVGWSSTAGTLSATSSTTNGAGVATVKLSAATVAGMGAITAALGGSNQTVGITFVADSSTATVASLSTSVGTLTANDSSSAILTAVLKDANGNIVGSGIPVTWSTSLGTLSAATSTTDASGQATVRLMGGKVAGVANVRAATTAGGKAIPVTVVADTATAAITGLLASPTTLVANGTSKSNISATVVDANGNLVGAGVTVNWTTTGGVLANTSSVTDAAGRVFTTFTSGTAAGTVTIGGAVSGQAKTIDLVLVADASTAQVTQVTRSVNSAIANGTSTVTLSATVKDANGNLVGVGVSVNWSATVGNLSGVSSTTDASGVATILASSKVAGLSTVTAGATGGSQTASVLFMADPSTASVVSMSVSQATIVANGVAQTTIGATLKDANGNALSSGLPVNWGTTGGSLGASTSVTDGTGTATVVLTAPSSVGTASVSASSVAGSKSTVITFIPDVSTATVVSLTSSKESLIADEVSTAVLTATVQDSTGNNVGAGVTVSWSNNKIWGGTLSASTSQTNAAGQAVVTLTSGPRATTTRSVQTASAVAGSKSLTIPFLADPSTARILTPFVPGSGNSYFANGKDPIPMTASVSDAKGNMLGAGQVVTWRTSDGSLASVTSVTDSSSTASNVLTSPVKAGPTTVTVSIGTSSVSGDVNFIADSTTSRLGALTASSSTAVANGDPITLTAQIVDANGNPVRLTNYVQFYATSGIVNIPDSGMILSDSNGVATVTVSSSTVGTVDIQAKLGFSSDAGKSIRLTFTQAVSLLPDHDVPALATVGIESKEGLVQAVVGSGHIGERGEMNSLGDTTRAFFLSGEWRAPMGTQGGFTAPVPLGQGRRSAWILRQQLASNDDRSFRSAA